MRLVAIVFTTLIVSAIGALAAPPNPPVPLNCDIGLFRYIETDKVRQEDYSFLLDLVTENNYDDMKRSIDTSWDGPYGFFKGKYDQFDVRRKEYRNEHQLTTDVKYSRDYALSKVDSNGLEAYKACLNELQPAQSLIVYRDNDASIDKLVTFVVKLKAEVNLLDLRVDVFGAGKLISSTDKDVKVSSASGVTHISSERLIGAKQFTFERESPTTEFRVTAEIAGLPAAPLTIGPRLKKEKKWVPTTLSEQGTFFYQSRAPENDWQYQIDTAPVQPIHETFEGNACLCANKKRTPATLPFGTAGLCAGTAEDVKIDTATVNLNTELLKPFQCANQIQSKPEVARSDPDGVCYTVRMSINADIRPSKSCTIKWELRGTAKKLQTGFVTE